MDVPTAKEIAQPLAKLVIIVEERTTLNLNADPRRDLASLSQGVTQGGQVGPMAMEMANACINAEYMK